MSLLEHTIWWQVFPLGALGSEKERGSNHVEDPTAPLDHIENWLDYLIDLGCNGLLLGPIFDSRTHGYDTLDHYTIDPRLGSEEDFVRVVDACRERGINVLLDGVFNHVSHNHRFLTEKPDFLKWEGDQPRGWEGIQDLVELDHANPAVADFVVDVMKHWLGRGISGWRLDVAYAVPTDFWRNVIGRVREEFPDAVFLGEIIHGDYAGFVSESTVDTVTQYELWKGVWSSLKDSNPWELAHALGRHAEFCETFIPQTFVSNHDVTRIASEVGQKRAAIAAGLLFTLPGSPSVYYGDEQGFTGVKRVDFGGDDDVRPKLPPTPDELSPLGADMLAWYQRLIALRRRNPWLVNAEISVDHKDNDVLEYTVRSEGEIKVRADYTNEAMTILAPDEEITL